MIKRFINRQTPVIGRLLTRAFGPGVMACRLISLITPRSPAGFRRIRIGNSLGDGGYVMVDDFSSISAALSIGIGGDVSWDLAIAERGIDVFQFDHTIDAPPATHPRFHFNPIGIGRATRADPRLRTLKQMIEAIPVEGDLLLKIDVEGAEWSALSSVSNTLIRRFSQIVIEIHGPLAGTSIARLRNLQRLRALARTHTVVHVHANNYGMVELFDGVEIPSVLEITYLRKRGARFTSLQIRLPAAEDVPNDPSRPEISMSSILQQCRHKDK